MSPSTLVVGAPDYTYRQSAVYIYRRAGSHWATVTKLTPDHRNQSGNGFGGAVAISGPRLIAGAPNEAPGSVGRHKCGTAYYFKSSGRTWSEKDEVDNLGCAVNDAFGSAVAISGTTIVIGAWGKKHGTGAVYPVNVN
jgi:hypothetical protein